MSLNGTIFGAFGQRVRRHVGRVNEMAWVRERKVFPRAFGRLAEESPDRSAVGALVQWMKRIYALTHSLALARRICRSRFAQRSLWPVVLRSLNRCARAQVLTKIAEGLNFCGLAFGVWCNGSTSASGALCLGSNPSTPVFADRLNFADIGGQTSTFALLFRGYFQILLSGVADIRGHVWTSVDYHLCVAMCVRVCVVSRELFVGQSAGGSHRCKPSW